MTHSQGQQAEHLRRVARGLAADDEGRVVVVFGAKGGVGVSAVALAVARDLAETVGPIGGVGVLAIDAHAGRDDLAVMASIGPPLPKGLALSTAARLGVAPPVAEAGVADAARRLVSAARRWTAEDGGWVVIDAGVGATPWARELASRASHALLVSTPDRVAAVNSYLTLKRLGPVASRVALVANHCDAPGAQELQASLAASAERFLGFAPTLAGWLPTTLEDSSAPLLATSAA